MAQQSQPLEEAVEVLEQDWVLTVQQESIQTQQQQDHQAHWERTARTTPETEVVEVLAVAEPMAEYQETVVQVTRAEQAGGLGLIWYHQAVHQVMGQVSHQEAQVKRTILQEWQSEAIQVHQVETEKRLLCST